LLPKFPKPKYPTYIDSRRGTWIYTDPQTNVDFKIQQNVQVEEYFQRFFIEWSFSLDKVIEIGTAGGGLSSIIEAYSKFYGFKFITYDIENKLPQEVRNKPPFDFRQKSAWEGEGYEEIINELKSEDKTLLLIDGGDKIKEFNLYVPHIKPGDYIMTHDYAPSKEYWEKYMKYGIWGWCQNTDADLNLSEVHRDKWAQEFINVAWSCFTK